MIKNMTKSKAIVILIVMMLALAGITYVDIAGVDASGRGSASDIKLSAHRSCRRSSGSSPYIP